MWPILQLELLLNIYFSPNLDAVGLVSQIRYLIIRNKKFHVALWQFDSPFHKPAAVDQSR